MTDHATIERVAFALFEEQGFDETTMGQIAEAVGVGRRTLFRYFGSKNDIPWGQFDESLRQFREELFRQPRDLPVAVAVHRCVVSFNDFDDAVMLRHRFRMNLILSTPTLQAHSALRYAAWRHVIAEYVAARLGVAVDSSLPRLAGHVSLAMAVSSYEQWLASDHESLVEILDHKMSELSDYLSPG